MVEKKAWRAVVEGSGGMAELAGPPLLSSLGHCCLDPNDSDSAKNKIEQDRPEITQKN
jgi:hypothetical protein